MKYRNRLSEGYHSKKEKNRASILRMMEKQGLITNLQEQVKFELIPTQYETVEVQLKTKLKINKKCIEKSCSYIADFAYTENGSYVVEDAKGFRTKDYIIKRKLMYYLYGIKIKET